MTRNPAVTAEDLPLELWAIIVQGVFLALPGDEELGPDVASVAALSRVSRTCRAAAHTLKHTVGELRSKTCLRALVESSAWPRLTIKHAAVKGDEIAALLPLMAARGIGLSDRQGGGLHVYLEHHAAAHPVPHLMCTSLLHLPETIARLAASLTSLDLAHCWKLEALPESLGQLGALTTLNLSGCTWLKALPESLGQLCALTTLNLGACHSLTALPDSLGQLGALTSLRLGCQALAALPPSIGQLGALTSLDLMACTCLTALPDSLGQLDALTTLNLSHCSRLETLPDSLEQLGALANVSTAYCREGLLPPSFSAAIAARALPIQLRSLDILA